MFFDSAVVFEIVELNKWKKEEDSYSYNFCRTEMLSNISNDFKSVVWLFIATNFKDDIKIHVYHTDDEDDWMYEGKSIAEMIMKKEDYFNEDGKPSILWVEAPALAAQGYFFEVATTEKSASIICVTLLGGPQMSPVNNDYLEDNFGSQYVELCKLNEISPSVTRRRGPKSVVTAEAYDVEKAQKE